MTRPGTGFPQWAMVDEGWGRQAVDFATLSEPGNCREYVAVHHDTASILSEQIGVGIGTGVSTRRCRSTSDKLIAYDDSVLVVITPFETIGWMLPVGVMIPFCVMVIAGRGAICANAPMFSDPVFVMPPRAWNVWLYLMLSL